MQAVPSGPVEAVYSLGAGTVPDLASGSGATTLFHYSNGPVKVPGPWSRGRPRGGTTRKAPKGKTSNYRFVHLTPGQKSAVTRKGPSQTVTKSKGRNRVSVVAGPSDCQAAKQPKSDFLALVARLNLHQIQGVDPFGQAPIRLEPYMLDLLRYYVETVWKNFYTLEYLAGRNPVSEFWLPRAFEDSALIHTFVGCSVAFAYGYHAIAFQSRGLRHLQDAISIVKRRLEIPETTFSSNTLAVIAGIAILEKGAGKHQNWEIHMQGLKSLVDQRGGKQLLDPEPTVLHKIHRTDLFGCLDTGQRSWFKGPSTISLSAQPTAPPRSKGFKALFEATDICPLLQNCVRELESSVAFWPARGSIISGRDKGAVTLPDSDSAASETATKPTPVQAMRMRDVLTEVQYALVSDEVLKHCDRETQGGRINNFCRISLIIYSLTILHEPTPSYTLGRQIGLVFSRAYSDILQHKSEPTLPLAFESIWPIPRDFCLWALFLAAVSMEGTECDTSSQFRAMFAQLATGDTGNAIDGSYADMKSRLRGYLWVYCIHDGSLERIWESLTRVTEVDNF